MAGLGWPGINGSAFDTLFNNISHIFPDLFSGPSQQEPPKYNPVFISNRVLIVAGVYALPFIVGLCGNTSVMSIVLYVNRVVLKDTSKSKEQNHFIFIIALCCVDSLVILSLPMALSNLLLGHWIFGGFLCKFYWLMESAGKIMSTFVLIVLSYFRFQAICYPHKHHADRAQLIALLVLCVAAILLLIPLPYSAETVTTVLTEPVFSGMGLRFFGTKCTVGFMEKSLFLGFTTYIFVLGYLIPLVLLSFFYTRVIMKLRCHKKSVKQSRIPIKRVTAYTVALLGFYFLCYTPYWLGTLISIIAPDFIRTQKQVYVMYFIHALPYVNSSLNFIFYAMLNAQVRRKISSARSGSRHKTTRDHSDIT